MPDLSVVFGTYNRLDLLAACLRSIPGAVGGLSYEAVIVDGGSTDGTLDYLRKFTWVRVVEHGELRGCIKAYNDGFQSARGEYVAYLNDDMTVMPGTLEAAVKMLREDAGIGIVSLPYSNNGGRFATGRLTAGTPPQHYPNACFGVLRRELGERAGWFGAGYYHYFGDCQLSATVLDMGYQVKPLAGDYGLYHMVADNAVRGANRWQTKVNADLMAKKDGELFYSRWCDWTGPHG